MALDRRYFLDQNNLIKKSSQMSLMGDICRRATKVLIWLGPQEEDPALLSQLREFIVEENQPANLTKHEEAADDVLRDNASFDVTDQDLLYEKAPYRHYKTVLRIRADDTRMVSLWTNHAVISALAMAAYSNLKPKHASVHTKKQSSATIPLG